MHKALEAKEEKFGNSHKIPIEDFPIELIEAIVDENVERRSEKKSQKSDRVDCAVIWNAGAIF